MKYKRTVNRIDPAKLWGIVVETHYKHKSISFFVGHNTYEFWKGFRK